MTSPDGITWTARSAAESNTWESVTYGSGSFVAVASSGTNRVMTSLDGTTWTARSAAEANSWKSVTYANGLFVAVALNGTNRVMTSPDGITWTARSAAVVSTWYSVRYGNGLFVAVGASAMYSSDGITWSTGGNVGDFGVTSTQMTYGNGLFVVTGYSGGYKFYTSPNGSSWTARNAPENVNYSCISYGNGLFMAVAQNGTNRVATSSDGINWTARSASEQNAWYSVEYGNGIFVAVSIDGTNKVMNAALTNTVTTPSGVRFLNRSNTPLTGTQKAIFGYGYPGNVTNLVSNTGVVANDTVGVGTWRAELAAASYGTDKAIFGYGAGVNYYSLTNLVSNTGVVANDTAGVGTARQSLAAAAYGNDKAIFGYGHDGAYYSITNKVSNTGVVSTNTTGIGTTRRYIAAAGYGSDKAIFGYGYNGTVDVSMTNLVSNTGVVATDTAGVGTARGALGAACYGVDKAIFGYGSGTIINLVSNTGVVATDTAGAGTGRGGVAAASYNIDKAIFGYGYTTTYVSMTNLVSNTGVVATDTTGVGTARYLLAAAGYSTSAPVIISTMRVSKIYADPALITTGLVLYLDASNASSYPGSGTTWFDLSGNGNNGTLVNGPTYTGSFGGGIVFDGTNDYVENSNFSSIVSSSFTISAWVKWTSISGTTSKILHAQNGTAEVNIDNYNGGSGNPKIHFYTAAASSTNNILTSGEDVQSGTWYYINAVFNNTTKYKYLYVNSVLKNSASTGVQISWPNSLTRIGNRLDFPEPFNGVMSQFGIYNRALSASEVLQNYNVTKTRFGL